MVMIEGVEVGMDHEFIQSAKDDFFSVLNKIEFKNKMDHDVLVHLFNKTFTDLELRSDPKERIALIERSHRDLKTSRHINERVSGEDYDELGRILEDLRPEEE